MLRHMDWMLQSACCRCTGSTHETGEIVNRRFGRDDLLMFLARQPAGRVALEACGSGHWWARKIKALGHEVVLLHAKFIRPFVQTNKTDAADARAIWTAVQQPGMRTVAAKTEDQQAMLGSAPDACLAGQVPHHAGEPVTRIVVRVWRTFRAGRWQDWRRSAQRMAELEDALPGAMMLTVCRTSCDASMGLSGNRST